MSGLTALLESAGLAGSRLAVVLEVLGGEDINSVDLKPIIDKKCHVNCHHAWEEYEKCEKRIEAKESGDCASWYMDYLKCIDTCASQVLFKGLH